jgi:hypothetical protein
MDHPIRRIFSFRCDGSQVKTLIEHYSARMCFGMLVLSIHKLKSMITASTQSKSPTRMILLSGLLVGTLDILAAIIISGAGAVRVLQYVAGGVFGKEAFAGGYVMAAWGLLFHYIIAFSWTLLFFFVFPKIHVRLKHFLITGVVIGFAIQLAMQFIVIPLSNVTRGPATWIGFFKQASILIFMIGIPLSWIYSRYYFPKKD